MKMPTYYRINGGRPLRGTVTISGAKNAAVAILPAAVLAGSGSMLENLPHIEDVLSLESILKELGATVDFFDDGRMVIDPTTITSHRAVSELCSSMRASYYLLGAMLARYGEVELALPGGCVIGSRPIDQHIKGMRALGATISIENNILRAHAARLVGTTISFDTVSVGATINVMLAAVLAEGKTILQNVAREPHVVAVASFLNCMGARVRGAGTDEIRITGVKELHGCAFSVIPDQIETGTYMLAAAATRGDVIIKNVIPQHMEALQAKLQESGCYARDMDDDTDFYIHVKMDKQPSAIRLETAPYPGFPTDLQQPMMAYLINANGVSTVKETIFENRMKHVPELRRLGASIGVHNSTATITGVTNLHGAVLHASDLRAGAALIIAALSAPGESRVYGVEFIDRGYEHLAEKLRALGADIERIEGDELL